MRMGLVLDGTAVDGGGTTLRASAARVEDLGFDLVWLRQDDTLSDPFVAATTVSAATAGLRIGVEVALGDVRPVVTAEQAAVCDLAVEGRLVLGLRAGPIDAETFGEALEQVIRSHRPRPFRSDGGRWPTPAGHEENAFMRDRTVRVTPAPAQLELSTWVVGDPAAAARLGLSPVSDGLEEGARVWEAIDAEMGLHALRLSRPALVDVAADGGRIDAPRLVDALVSAQGAWGLDTALLRLPAGLTGEAADRAWEDLARIVRPRVQQERIPAGLVAWWDEELMGP